MGDADTTYDFTELPKLCELVCDGDADMAMGSRLDGTIKPGAMPALHKYIGNPLLTRFLNLFYDAGVSDAHSGMRVFSRDAWDEMECSPTGMEFASEMIMEAGANNLEIKEAPIRLPIPHNPTDSGEVYINDLTEPTVELNTLRVPGGHVCRFASANVIRRNKNIPTCSVLTDYSEDDRACSNLLRLYITVCL